LQRVPGAVGEPEHHGEIVGDDVVHLTRDPGPLRRRPEPSFLIALEFQPRRGLLQGRDQRRWRMVIPNAPAATPSPVSPIQYLAISVGDQRTAAISAPASITTAAAASSPMRPSSASQYSATSTEVLAICGVEKQDADPDVDDGLMPGGKASSLVEALLQKRHQSVSCPFHCATLAPRGISNAADPTASSSSFRAKPRPTRTPAVEAGR
jgi:hypothetical protein